MGAAIEQLTVALSDRYRIERELGAGGMATVYLAHDLKHDRDVALKVLRPDLAALPGAERFLQEIRISASLDHPHILTLIDSGQTEGILYYVLPFVRGETLRAKLEREKQLPVEEALSITRQVASALDYAHKRGVIHRDIKPENILFHEGEAVVADFGVALALSEARSARLTETGFSLGTPQYMSPEQATSDRTPDARSDIYSLGAVLYEMLAGEPPHTGRTTQAVIAKLLTEPPVRLRTLRDSIPESIDSAVMKALAKIPADRFATAHDFAQALAQPTTQAGQRAKPRRAPRLAGAVMVLVGALLLVWIARSVGFLPRTSRAADTDPRHLAVLYFRPAADTLAFLADGLTEGLIQSLATVPTLQVISSNGTLPYRGARIAPDSIRRALGVGALVDGTVVQADSMLRVTVSLVDAATAGVLGNATFDKPVTDILTLQDSIVAAVATFLRRRLGEEIATREERQRTRNAEAWRLVQQANTISRDAYTLLAQGDTAAARRELVRADSQLVHASMLDPDWTRPLIDRGWLVLQSTDLSGTTNQLFYDEATKRGLTHAAAALTLRPNDPEALTLRGNLRYLRSVMNLGASAEEAAAAGDSAESDLRAAVAIDPHHVEAWTLLSHRLMRTNKTPEAKLAAMRAYEADPYMRDAGAILWRLYAASLDLEDPVEARRWCDEGRRRFATAPQFIECQITVQALPGQRPDVATMWRLLEENVQAYGPIEREFRRRRGQLLVAFTLLRAGLADSARAVALRARVATSRDDPVHDLTYIEMMLRNQLGDRDEALRLAALFYAANPQERIDCGPSGTDGLDRTWWLRGLVDDPRYRAIVCKRR